MDPKKASIFKTYEKEKSSTSAGTFASFMIIGPVCFFLGILFMAFPYDFPILWTNAETPPAYYDQLEAHIRFVHASPPIIPRILHIAIFVGFAGLFIKLFKPSEANLLFDGASLVLYVIGVIVYIANIVKGFRLITLGMYLDAPSPGADAVGEGGLLGKEDSMKVLAASNTILALVLVGVLVLQAGQWYAERKEQDEAAAFERDQEEKSVAKSQKAGGHVTRSSSKKNK